MADQGVKHKPGTRRVAIHGKKRQRRWERLERREMAEKPLGFEHGLRTVAMWGWGLAFGVFCVSMAVEAVMELGLGWDAVVVTLTMIVMGFVGFGILLFPLLVATSALVEWATGNRFLVQAMWWIHQQSLRLVGRASLIDTVLWMEHIEDVPVRLELGGDSDRLLWSEFNEARSQVLSIEHKKPPGWRQKPSLLPPNTNPLTQIQLGDGAWRLDLTRSPDDKEALQLELRDSRTGVRKVLGLDARLWLRPRALERLPEMKHEGVVALTPEAQRTLVPALMEACQAWGVHLPVTLQARSAPAAVAEPESEEAVLEVELAQELQQRRRG